MSSGPCATAPLPPICATAPLPPLSFSPPYRTAQQKVVRERGSGHVPLLSSRGEVTESDIAGVISSWTGEGAGGEGQGTWRGGGEGV